MESRWKSRIQPHVSRVQEVKAELLYAKSLAADVFVNRRATVSIHDDLHLTTGLAQRGWKDELSHVDLATFIRDLGCSDDFLKGRVARHRSTRNLLRKLKVDALAVALKCSLEEIFTLFENVTTTSSDTESFDFDRTVRILVLKNLLVGALLQLL